VEFFACFDICESFWRRILLILRLSLGGKERHVAKFDGFVVGIASFRDQLVKRFKRVCRSFQIHLLVSADQDQRISLVSLQFPDILKLLLIKTNFQRFT
jgi:hypothetical protein